MSDNHSLSKVFRCKIGQELIVEYLWVRYWDEDGSIKQVPLADFCVRLGRHIKSEDVEGNFVQKRYKMVKRNKIVKAVFRS